MTGLVIAAIRMLCPDPVATASFYEAALGFRQSAATTGLVTLQLGRERIELASTRAKSGRPALSQDTEFQHFAIIVSEMEAAYARLRSIPGWTAISRSGPERLPQSSGGVTAFKFRDPDGHPVELLSFPTGAVPEPWRARAGIYLGIDHTAVTVLDTERSIAFYAGLGFTVATRSLNTGPDQERLDDAGGAVVEVTGLMPPGGAPPHLELLCYRTPAGSTSTIPDDAVLATRTIMDCRSAGASSQKQIVTELFDLDGHRLVHLGA